jgi:hypothetical protein
MLSGTVREQEVLKRIPAAERAKVREQLRKSSGDWVLESYEKQFAPPAPKAPKPKARAKPLLRSTEPCPCGKCGAQRVFVYKDEADLKRMRSEVKTMHEARMLATGGSRMRFAAPVGQLR